ncbi:MAG TPA: DoxX family protein [Bryobacteraceae bacterium]
MKTTANILAWILAVLLAVIFLFAGGVKLLGSRAMVQEFTQIGAGQWLRYVTGVFEVSGAIGVLIPKYRFWVALQLAAVMVGATAINIWVLHTGPLARLTAVLLALSLVLAWLRRPQKENSELAQRGSSAGYRRVRTRA